MGQEGWQIPFVEEHPQDARTTIAMRQISISVQSFDYGGWTTGEASAEIGHVGSQVARDKRGPATGPNVRYFCRIPYDADNDNIADFRDQSSIENGFDGANRDNEILRGRKSARRRIF